ncbi:MAG TPA: hypothetical protein VKU82_13045, partial [Planctomycetaceae bacterium]|nr:hypothetical protein [Planctomycetaceae bacterium]
EQLEALTGRPARHFCYPQGFWNKAAWESLERNGVESATTTQHGPNLIGTPDLALRRLLDGESRTQLEFEVETSQVRWLAHVLVHWGRFAIPSEKTEPYFDTYNIF